MSSTGKLIAGFSDAVYGPTDQIDDSGVKQESAEQATAYQQRGKNKKKPVSTNPRADDPKTVILQEPFEAIDAVRSQVRRIVVEIESVTTS